MPTTLMERPRKISEEMQTLGTEWRGKDKIEGIWDISFSCDQRVYLFRAGIHWFEVVPCDIT